MDQFRQERIEEGLRNLQKALNDSGPHPIAHHEIMIQSRREWPTLWKAIDALLMA